MRVAGRLAGTIDRIAQGPVDAVDLPQSDVVVTATATAAAAVDGVGVAFTFFRHDALATFLIPELEFGAPIGNVDDFLCGAAEAVAVSGTTVRRAIASAFVSFSQMSCTVQQNEYD